MGLVAEGATPDRAGLFGLLGVIAAAAALWAVVGSAWVFPHLSANSDEGIYLLQADALLDGDLAPPAPATDQEAFLPWFAVADDGRYVLKYTPVHASVLAVGSLLPGPDRVALGLLAAAQVLVVAALAHELGARRRAVVFAAIVFAVSPLTLLLGISYLAYGTSLVLGLGALALALRALRLGSSAVAAGAGLVWGLALFARPYDALLVAVVTTVAVLARAQRPDRLEVMAWGVGAAGPVVLLLAFNQATTGDPFQLPFNLLEDADRLGFGDRRALPTDAFVHYGPHEAVSALGRNLLLVVAWTGGGLVSVVLAAWTLWKGLITRAAVLGLLVVWPLGYALFWGSYLTAFVWDGALFLGPYYYFPMVAAVSIGAGAALDRLGGRRPAVAGLAAAGLVALTLATIVPAVDEQLDRSSSRTTLADALDDVVDEPALVFLPPVYGPYLQNPFSFLRNSPDLDGDRVYALTRNEVADRRVRTRFADRAAYVVRLSRGWSDQPGFDPVIEIEQLPPPEG